MSAASVIYYNRVQVRISATGRAVRCEAGKELQSFPTETAFMEKVCFVLGQFKIQHVSDGFIIYMSFLFIDLCFVSSNQSKH